MYVIAALAVLTIGFALRRVMIPDPDPGTFSYVGVLRSLSTLWRDQPELRVRSLYAMFGLSGFSALWTGLTFLLTAPHDYSPSTVGLFGLIGAAGALSANLAGRLGDRGHATAVTGAFAVVLVLSWAILEAGSTSMIALIAGIFLLDVAAQGLQVTHQAVVYRLDPEARSRITVVFVTAGFVGMALGSAVGSAGYAYAGWLGVRIAGAALPALMLAH
jgi:predicted MFS family arabinose efflux permease